MKSKFKIPKELKPVKLPPKPEPDVSVNPLDRFRLWLSRNIESAVRSVVSMIIPKWVFPSVVVLAGVLIAVYFIWLR